jgi:hypothetical protein
MRFATEYRLNHQSKPFFTDDKFAKDGPEAPFKAITENAAADSRDRDFYAFVNVRRRISAIVKS